MIFPEISMPTEKQLDEQAQNWILMLEGTSLDELPREVLSLSVPTNFITVDVDGLVGIWGHDEERRAAEKEWALLVPELEDGWGWDRKVVKLCTRSPKDAWENHGVTASAKQALYWFMCSERILFDFTQFSRLPDRKPKICVRDVFWGRSGLGSWEFRCFVKDGNLIAVTDYDYTRPNKFLKSDEVRAEVRAAIDDFFAQLNPMMPIQDYVFDVVFETGKGDRPTLIEVNPYGLSDPCFLKSYTEVEAFVGDIAWFGNEASQ